MTSPDSFSEEEAAARFDDALRQQLGDVEVPPAPAAWETLRAQLPAPPLPPRRGRVATFGGGLLVGALLWWGGTQVQHHPGPVSAPAGPETTVGSNGNTVGSSGNTIGSSGNTVGSNGNTIGSNGNTVGSNGNTVGSNGNAVGSNGNTVGSNGNTIGSDGNTIVNTTTTGGGTATTGGTAGVLVAVAGGGTPVVPVVHVAPTVEGRDSVIRREVRAYLAPVAAPADTARPARLRALVAAQTRALAVLTARLDSVKQFLDARPPAPLVAAGAKAAAPDSVADALANAATATEWPPLPPRAKWSALLLAETTPSWAVLPTGAAQPRQEETVAAHGQQVLGQWQATPRWAVRAGVGQAALTTQARTVAERTGTSVVVDSTLTTDVRNYQTLSVVEIIRRDTIFIYEPILNASLQIIGYDTSFVISADTTRTLITTTVHDTVHRTVVTERTETLRERAQQQFRPAYQFWTLPVGVHYALLTTPRWTVGTVLGGQLSVFRGGTRPVWTGDAYELRAVGRRDGPYRPVSVSLSAGLEAQYRLSPRLSAVLAPTVRWWAVSPLRQQAAGGATRRLLPAAQLGLSYGF